ncbi:uncharacterized protein LOC126264922 [Aethina tumida]|uniref:uncharacterized protein LOC126264922 n=1 Tax=Aethina tumida TaxID=116153 RepID=UPI0021479217|nr:uncharacterized protein LOC126264922 [Aethina tumida]
MSSQLFNDSWETAQEIVQKMSDEMIVNGIILLPSIVEPNQYDVFSWYPYHDGALTFLTWKISIHNNNESTSYKSYSNNLQNCYAIFYGISVKTLPRSNMSRLFIGLFIFLSFNMDSAYQTYFTSVLTSHHEDFLYNNVNDILKANLKMKILNNDFRYFTGIKNQKFWDFMEICMDIKECLIDVALNKTSVISTPFLFKEYVLNSLVSKNKRPLLNCFKKRINNFPVTIVMKKGFPLCHSINNVILRLLGAGLVNKWEKDILREKAREDIFKVVQDYDDGEYDYNMKERPFKLHNFLPINKWYTKRNEFV